MLELVSCLGLFVVSYSKAALIFLHSRKSCLSIFINQSPFNAKTRIMYAITQRAPLCCRVMAAAERSLSSTQAKGSAAAATAAAVGQRGVGIAAAAAVRRSVGGSETARAARWRQCGAAG